MMRRFSQLVICPIVSPTVSLVIGLIALAFNTSVAAQTLPDAASQLRSPVRLPSAYQWDLHAVSNGHTYRIFVAVPGAPPPAGGYPVLYTLDGNASFPVAALIARNVESRMKVTGLTPPIVVGIGYPGDSDYDADARKRDYTIGGSQDDTAGAADLFLDVIEKEIKPAIAAAYPVDRQRQALFGHSFGGLFVLHSLLTRPTGFATYLASSPSIWWNDKQILSELPAFQLAMHGKIAPRVQISVGSLEDALPNAKVSAETRALLSRRLMVADAHAMALKLRNMPEMDGRFRYYELHDEDHGSAWMPALTRGMKLFLKQP